MRVVVVGAGGAGLAAAWLLSSSAEVVLLEREDRLGGHMRTIPVETERGTVYAEMGFKHFFEPTYPIFRTIHRLLGLKTSSSRPTITVTTPEGVITAPPFSLRHAWQWISQPALALRLLDYYRFIFYSSAPPEACGALTLASAARRWGMSEEHLQSFFLPLIAANWGSPLADIADNPWWEVRRVLIGAKKPLLHLPEGLGGYVATLRASMPDVRILCSTPATRLARAGEQWHVSAGSEQLLADHVVVATEAPNAHELISMLPDKAHLARLLETVETFHTTIAVHRDPAWMPTDRRDWSAINVVIEPQYPWQTEWSGRELGVDVFRSWVMPGHKPPSNPEALHHFRHVVFRANLAEVQRQIREVNGADGLWLAGMYTTGADYHESAVRSAVNIACKLTRGSPRLLDLKRAAPPDAWHELSREVGQ